MELPAHPASVVVWGGFALAFVFGAVAIPSVAIWTLFGSAIRRFLKSERSRTLFNWSMAALLVASLLPFVFG